MKNTKAEVRECDVCGAKCGNPWEDLCQACQKAKRDYETLTAALEINEDPKRLKAAMVWAEDQVEDAQDVLKKHKGIRG